MDPLLVGPPPKTDPPQASGPADSAGRSGGSLDTARGASTRTRTYLPSIHPGPASHTETPMSIRIRSALPLALVLLPSALSAQGTAADYARAASLADRTRGLVYGTMASPTWVGGSRALWYTVTVKGGMHYLLADPATGQKRPAFDHDRLATALSGAIGRPYTAATLPLTGLTFTATLDTIEFNAVTSRWRCTLASYQCASTGPATTPGAGAGPGGRGGPGQTGQGRGGVGAQTGRGGPGAGAAPGQAPQIPTRRSPDGRLEIAAIDDNLMIRITGDSTARWERLSFDGAPGSTYRLQSAVWAPDSRTIAAYRTRPVVQRQVTYVESSPADQLQPRTTFRNYEKPGDVLAVSTPVVFDVATRTQRTVDNSLFPNPFSMGQLAWRSDSKRFTFEYNQRGHQVYRVIEVDAASATARALIDEHSESFIYYRPANGNLTESGDYYRFDVDGGAEIIWMSMRDGYNHLYLLDGTTGAVKNRITSGPGTVMNVERVDVQNRQVWYRAAGTIPGQDPYLQQYYHVNFDGTGTVALTEADGTHSVSFSPDREYYIDTWQRVNLPPVSVLRRTSDQRQIMELARGDAGELLKTGWRMPEVFTAKGRDGTTDIWGLIIRPTNFDPKKKYPVIEYIYAGPQGSFVPKTFSTQTGMQALAELGFIVVQVDGMGTANRGKAFHSVIWQNLGDGGFPDRILWHQAIAAKYPWYDISRVGIYGTSAGGQNALGALLFHPEFYKVAVPAAGSHDNRIDKIWWNELWMGWPIGPHYGASSNVDNAHRLQGKLLLIVGEMDTNVDPASTLQVVNALIKANKVFDLLFIPGGGHSAGGAYGEMRRNDFFVKHLLGVEPPNRNTPVPAPANR